MAKKNKKNKKKVNKKQLEKKALKKKKAKKTKKKEGKKQKKSKKDKKVKDKKVKDKKLSPKVVEVTTSAATPQVNTENEQAKEVVKPKEQPVKAVKKTVVTTKVRAVAKKTPVAAQPIKSNKSVGVTAVAAVAKIKAYKTASAIDNYIVGEKRVTVLKAAEVKKRQLS